MANKRKTVYNSICSDEVLGRVLPDNFELQDDFLEHLKATDHSPATIKQYKNNLQIFWCWNQKYNKNKFFIDLKKREIAKFQAFCLETWGWSPKRMKTVRATLSSLANYIEEILDDEYPEYKNIIQKIKPPKDMAVREKSVFSEKELKDLLDELLIRGDIEKACMLALAMYSGRRKAELPQFKVSYFTEENTIAGGGLYKTPEKIRTKGSGVRGKLLELYVLKPDFDPYLKLWLEERERLGIDTEYLFPDYEDGKYFDKPLEESTMNSWAEVFSRITKKKFYWHSMRHFFTTKLKQSGLPENIIQFVIGWESSDMVQLYDDTPIEGEFDKYFNAGGVKTIEVKSLEDL